MSIFNLHIIYEEVMGFVNWWWVIIRQLNAIMLGRKYGKQQEPIVLTGDYHRTSSY
jgi:hypothetical protein